MVAFAKADDDLTVFGQGRLNPIDEGIKRDPHHPAPASVYIERVARCFGAVLFRVGVNKVARRNQKRGVGGWRAREKVVYRGAGIALGNLEIEVRARFVIPGVHSLVGIAPRVYRE